MTEKLNDPIELLTPILEPNRLKHVGLFACSPKCGEGLVPSCCGNFIPSKCIPTVVIEDDEIKTAKEAIEAAFAGITTTEGVVCADSKASEKILELLNFEPKQKLGPKIKDSLVTQIAEKILDKMQGRVAVLDDKKVNLSCLPVGSKVNILSFRERTIDEIAEAHPDLNRDEVDGVIEDLIGVIEVTR